jgi:probable rRNA maturation factor
VPGELETLARDALVAALTAAGYDGPAPEVSVLLTDDEGIAELHGQYLGARCPTDVMSFPSRGERGGEPDIKGAPDDVFLGDIVISEDAARSQAIEYGHSTEREIALLVVHGALHLIGYDDQDPTSAGAMREMEEKALTLL